MKTIDEFLSELRHLDVKLWNEGDRLRYKAPKETLTPALLQELKERKAEILAFLHKANAATSSNLSPILPVPRDGNLPLSFAQQRLWFLAQLEPDSPAYNIPAAFRLTGLLNVTALSQSLSEIVRRHEVLRTTFLSVDGQPKQVISLQTGLTLPVIDLRELPLDQGLSEAQRLATEEAQQPFNLATGPLFRVKLLRLEEAEHMLLVTMHHIVYDGWSYDIFLRELAALYDAFSSGKPSPLPELPIQYADFAHWQREWLQGEVLESQRDYWKQQLNGNLPILQLPIDYPRPPVQTYPGGYQSLELPKNLTQALKDLSQQERVTLFMTLLAAFQTFLYRYTGQEDMIVGTPIAGRNQVEAEGLIGFFVNTLALRTYLSGNPSFQELLGRVREVALGAYAHQDLPFEKLVEELQPERDRSRTPLFQVMFVLQNTPTSALELPGLTVNSLNIDSGTAKFDLTLFMIETAQGLRASLEYNTDLFNPATITRMLGNFQTLLEGIVANPKQRLSDLPLLTASEQHQLLVEWNNTTKEYPQDKCIHQLVEAQVEQAPDAVAVVYEGEQLTYRELNARANQLAHYLQVLGVGPEVLVGICVERSLEMLVGLLGILKAGGAYVPLDPAYPLERLAFMLEDASVSVLLTQARLVKSLPQHHAPVVCLDRDWEVLAQYSEENPFSGVTPKNLAYVIYTSGSTGKPKGVLVEHRGLLNLVFWHQRSFTVSSKDRATQLAGSAFDASVWELWPYLSAGASIYIANEQTRVLPQQLRDWLVKNAITISFLPTPLAESILSLDWSTNVALRTLLTGGDKLHNNPLPSVPFELVNNYGPTENTVVTTSCFIPAKPRTDMTPPIGRPIANTQVYLLDEKLQPVPIGVSGELYVSGDGLARGYLNRPDLTAQKFIANPFSDNPSVSGTAPEKLSGCDSALRLYKTGDLARYLPDGNIEFLGRLDEQVKIRGFRIELGEIEALLAQHPDLREVVVVVREDIPGNKFLAAYVVPKLEASPPTISELRSFLKTKLPDYMVPGAFVFLEAMPLTPNGKIDRRALPVPASFRGEQEDNFVAPSTPTEEILAAIWAEVLGLQQVGINDNFFELGGHSMLAARLFAQIEKAFGKNLPLATLFQSPTIEQLANILRQKGWSAPWQTLVTIQPGGSKPPLFFFHVLGEGLKFCRPLAGHLDPEQPIYGLAVGIMDEVSLNKIEDLVAHYLKEMRIIQPEGPYFLAGIYCGGRIAYEVAEQLHAQDQKVALLALLDTLKDDTAIKIMPVADRILAHWNNFLRVGPAYLLRKMRLGQAKNRLMSIYCKFYERMGLPLPQACQNFTYRKKKEEGNMQWGFAPKNVYPDRVTLFRAIENIGFLDPDLGWRELAPGGLEIHDVPGNTVSMLQEPHVQVLAEKLRDCIDRLQADDLPHIPPLCSDPFVCDNEDSEG
ncbi:amino acid adenylation domain-containing protein [Microcoleus sp. FACHB-53]|nr:amino acid adenylation domain-containing protein [Microcoleus sp. FACHB-53]